MAKARVQPPRAAKRRPRGRPPVHHERWSKVSVVLFDRQVIALDRLAADIRRQSGHVLNRAGIIRALVDGLIKNHIDIATIGGEADLRRRIAKALAALSPAAP